MLPIHTLRLYLWPSRNYIVSVQVTRTTYFPVLVRADDRAVSADHPIDGFLGELAVAYSPGPPYGDRLVTHDELYSSGLLRSDLRHTAAESLYDVLDLVAIHGQPPSLMLAIDGPGFDGLASSVLLAHSFWEELADSVPGELVVGVPARDVVIFTGAGSRSGLQRVRRAVDRVFFAGSGPLLSRELLVRRGRRWEVFPEPSLPEEMYPLSPAVGDWAGLPLSTGPAR
jgi:uncharacterized protein YtpQ (UPF0354 family)